MWSGFAGYLGETGQTTSTASDAQDADGPLEQAVTGANIPEPPETDQEVDLNNDVESDGITNEDAGF